MKSIASGLLIDSKAARESFPASGAFPADDQMINRQKNDRAENGEGQGDEKMVIKERLAFSAAKAEETRDEAADDRTRDSDQHCHDTAAGIAARRQKFSNRASDQAED